MKIALAAMSIVVGMCLAGGILAQAQEKPAFLDKSKQQPWDFQKTGSAEPMFPAGKGFGWRRFMSDRDGNTSGAAGWRAQLLAEIKKVPTFEKYLREFFRLQLRRTELEQKRHRIAMASDKPSDELLRQFHDVLREEELVTSEGEKLLRQLRADRAVIEEEMKNRVRELDEIIAVNGRDKPKARNNPDLEALQRARRFYNTCLAHLDSLDEVPSAFEWFGNVFRAAWVQQRLPNPTVEGAMRQLERLQREQEELRRRLENVQNSLDDIAELLSTLRSPDESLAPRAAGRPEPPRGSAPYEPHPPAPPMR